MKNLHLNSVENNSSVNIFNKEALNHALKDKINKNLTSITMMFKIFYKIYISK